MQVLHCSFRTLQVLSSRTLQAPSHNTLRTRPRAPHSILDAIMDTRTFRLILLQMISACLSHAQQPMAQRLTRESPKLLIFVVVRRFASCKSSTTCDMVCLLSPSIVLSICCCSDPSELDCFASPSSTPCFLLPRSGPAIAIFLCSLAFNTSSIEVTSPSIMSAEAISSLHHNTSASDAYPRYTHGPVPNSRCPSH